MAFMSASIVKAGERALLNVLGMPLRFLCDSRETGGAWSLFEEEVPFGMGPMPHRHDWDEAYYILDGEVDFEIDGQLVTSRTGDFIYLPRNTVHSFKGASSSSARVLIFAAPAHASAFFEEVNSEVRSLPEDLAKVPEIGARHGIHFLPQRREAGV
jgi:mannose-6-phosphate isomerase-like protein (cupin superfamily)